MDFLLKDKQESKYEAILLRCYDFCYVFFWYVFLVISMCWVILD